MYKAVLKWLIYTMQWYKIGYLIQRCGCNDIKDGLKIANLQLVI